MDDNREWYTANTGYVLQLATPYYEELTVRENLTLAAEMKLPSSMKQDERFKRVEQVIQVVCAVIIILVAIQPPVCPRSIYPIRICMNSKFPNFVQAVSNL